MNNLAQLQSDFQAYLLDASKGAVVYQANRQRQKSGR